VLAYELAQRGLQTVSQQAIPAVYGTMRIAIEPAEALAPVHR
jgi:hypothetical protein